MPSQYRHRRTSVAATAFPATIEPGEIAVNTANRQLALGDAAAGTLGAPLALLAIRYFDARAQYATNDYVIESGIVYRANAPISPGAFNASNWTAMVAAAGTFILKAGDTGIGALTMTGALTNTSTSGVTVNPATGTAQLLLNPTQAAQQASLIFRQTGTNKWVVSKDGTDNFLIYDSVTPLTVISIPSNGTTVNFGRSITLPSNPTVALHAATKGYVDAKPALTISDTPPGSPLDNSMWWDSDTGTLFVRYNDGVGAAQWVQATAVPSIDTSAFVQKGGSTMSGALTLSGNPTVALHAVPKQYADAPVDEKSYARRGATWAETPRYQNFPLGGIKSVDVTVPAGAKMARVSGLVMPTTATAIDLMVHLSVSAGVFVGTAAQYQLNGFVHLTSAPNAVTGLVADITRPGMMLCPSHNSIAQPVMFDGSISLSRAVTTVYFKSTSHATFIIDGNTYSGTYHNIAPGISTGLSVLAFRFLSTTGANFSAESILTVEWM